MSLSLLHTLLNSPSLCLFHALSWTPHLSVSLTHCLELPVSLSLLRTLLNSPSLCLSHILSWTPHLSVSLKYSNSPSLSFSCTLSWAPHCSVSLMHCLELPISFSLSRTLLKCPSLCLSHALSWTPHRSLWLSCTLSNCPSISLSLSCTLLNCPSLCLSHTLSWTAHLSVSLTHSWTAHLSHALLNFPSLCVFFPVTSHQCKCLLSMRTTTMESKHTLHVDAMFYGCSWLANMLWNAPDLLRCLGDVSDIEECFFHRVVLYFVLCFHLQMWAREFFLFLFFSKGLHQTFDVQRPNPKIHL